MSDLVPETAITADCHARDHDSCRSACECFCHRDLTGPLLADLPVPETAITDAAWAIHNERVYHPRPDHACTCKKPPDWDVRAATLALAAAAPLIDAAARASERETIRQLAVEKRATCPVFDAPGLIGSHEPFADLIGDTQ